MKKAKILIAVLLLALAFALTACGNNGGGAATGGNDGVESRGTVTWWTWGDFEELGIYRMYRYIPDIDVEFTVFPSDEFISRFQTAVAAGSTLPDIFNVEIDHRATMYSIDGLFHVLDDAPFNIDRSVMVPFSIPLVSNPQGQILGVQIDNCVGGFLFKRDLALEFFGTDDVDEVEALFQTPEDYVYWARRVYEQSNGRVNMFASAGDAFRAFGSLGHGNSAPKVVDYQLNIRNLFMDTFNIMEGLARYNGIGTHTGWSPGWMASFSGDDVIFFPGPTWFISHVVKPNDPDGVGNWGLISPPGGAFSWGGTAYSIPLGAENPELAWEVIRWLTLSQAGAESFFSAHSTPTLYLPAYATDLYTNNPDPFFRGQDIVSKMLDIATHPNTQSRPLSVFDSFLVGAAASAWIEMVDNGLSAADAMDMFEEEAMFMDARLHR